MSEIKLRPAIPEDAKMVFEWRNDSKTRQYIFNPHPIVWEAHLAWFGDVIKSNSRYLLIGELEGEPVGVLRLDVNEGVAEVSLCLGPEFRGRRLGSTLLKSGCKWAQNNLLNLHKLKARVLPQNIASMKAFEEVGFAESYRVYELEVQ